MPKHFKPTMGFNVEDYLEMTLEDIQRMHEPTNSDYEEYKRYKNTLLRIINTRSCLSEGQFELTKDSVRDVLGYVDSLSENCFITPAHFVREVQRLGQLFNTFRLSCHDCLNPDCKHRDPDFPVKKVQKRAKQFEEYEE